MTVTVLTITGTGTTGPINTVSVSNKGNYQTMPSCNPMPMVSQTGTGTGASITPGWKAWAVADVVGSNYTLVTGYYDDEQETVLGYVLNFMPATLGDLTPTSFNGYEIEGMYDYVDKVEPDATGFYVEVTGNVASTFFTSITIQTEPSVTVLSSEMTFVAGAISRWFYPATIITDPGTYAVTIT